MKLTDKLDALMREKNINKSVLSREAEIPYTTIDGLYKKGADNIKLSTLKKLSIYFDCSLDFLADDAVSESVTTVAAHLDTEELTRDELDDVANYIELVKKRRSK